MKFIIFAILAFACFAFNWNTNFYDFKWPLFFFCSSLYAFKEFGKLERVIISYCLASFAYVGFFHLNHYELRGVVNPLFQIESMRGALHFICAIFMVKGFLNYEHYHDKIKRFLQVLFYANCLWMIVSSLFELKCFGIDGAKSPNGTLIALTIPLIGVSWLHILLGLAAVLVSKTTMGIVGILAILGYVAFYEIKNKKILLIAPIVFAGIVGVSYYLYGPELYSFTGRIEVWELAYKFWSQEWNMIVFGTGGGTFSFMMPVIQKLSKFLSYGYFVFLHSDIFQVTFEFGLIGLFLFSAFFIKIIYELHSNSKNELTCFFVVLVVSCLGNFPFRLGPDVFLICFAISKWMVERKKYVEENF